MDNRRSRLGYILAVVSVLAASVTAQDVCRDLDAAACHAIPGVCSDPIMAESACPKTCNFCPLVCYQCTTTFDDRHLCNTTKTCAKDEVCMKKVVTSVADGHHEYQLSCEPKNHCDGRDLILSFGKRGLAVRDLSVSCCFDDMCNSATAETTTTAAAATHAPTHTTVPLTTPTPPPTTAAPPTAKTNPPTTTKATNPPTTHVQTTHTPHATHTPIGIQTCKKDIVVLLEDSDRHTDEVHVNNIKGFLSGIVSHLIIGPQAALMSLTKFTEHYRTMWELDTYTDTTALSNAITALSLFHNHDHTELDVALNYALHHETSSGHRADAGDVVIIISDDKGGSDSERLVPELRNHFDDVIEIVIDNDFSRPGEEYTHVGSDSHHEFTMTDSRKLRKIIGHVISLICQ